MKDFSLLYGPLRTWLPVIAMAVLALIVVINQAGSGSDCEPAGPDDCAEPLLGERQLLGNGGGLGGGLDGAPAGATIEESPDLAPSPWDRFEPSSEEVPFMPLRPSSEPMTDAGEDLVRSATSDEGDDPDRR